MKTLKLQLPIGQTFIQAILLLTVFSLILEASARTDSAEQLLGKYEFFGSTHPHFDTQIINIRERAKAESHIDCIFVGNSQVLHGINPDIVEQIYFEQTGKKIVCQNFGLGGVTPLGAISLIKTLIDMYQPSVVIYGTSVIDYTYRAANGADTSLTSSSWLKYKLNEFTIAGWLIENSTAYRYYLGADAYLLNQHEPPPSIQKNGYYSREGKAETSMEDQINFANGVLPKSNIQEPQVNAVLRILQLQTSETDIILLEVPFTSLIFEIKPKTEKIRAELISSLIGIPETSSNQIWFTQDNLKFSDSDWYDIIHLNNSGTEYFSLKIGEWLAHINSYPR